MEDQAVGRLRSDLVVSMAEVGRLLASSNEKLSALQTLLPSTLALGSPPGDWWTEYDQSLNGLQGTFSAWRGWIAKFALGQIFASVSKDLSELSKMSQLFRFLASITAIQIAREKSGELLAFINDMKAMPDQIVAQTEALAVSVDQLLQCQDRISRVIEDSDRRIAQVVAQSAAWQAQRQGHDGEVARARDGVAVAANGFAAVIQRQIMRLVTGIQFSDAVSQRFEHVEAILQAGDDPAFRALAAAQLDALAEDGDREVQEIAAAFRTLIAEGGICGGRLVELVETTGRINRDQATASEGMQDSSFSLVPMIASAAEDGRRVIELIEAVTERLGALTRIGEAINLAAMNARLKAMRTALSKAEMSYIAGSVKETADRCSASIDRCRASIVQVRKANESDSVDSLRIAADRFDLAFRAAQAALEQAQADTATAEEVQAALSRDVTGLKDLGQRTDRALSTVAGVLRRARALAAEIRPEGALRPEAARLDRFLPLYTMDRERAVHADLTGQKAVAAVAQQDSLLDVLF